MEAQVYHLLSEAVPFHPKYQPCLKIQKKTNSSSASNVSNHERWFGICCWIYTCDVDNSNFLNLFGASAKDKYQTILHKKKSSIPSFAISISRAAQSIVSLKFFSSDGKEQDIQFTHINVSKCSWQHITLLINFSSGQVSLTLNGQQYATQSFKIDPEFPSCNNNPLHTFTIGSLPKEKDKQEGCFVGFIGELSFYEEVLNPQQLFASIWQHEKKPSWPTDGVSQFGENFCFPLLSVDQLLQWKLPQESVEQPSVTFKSVLKNQPRILHCHDMKGGYIGDNTSQINLIEKHQKKLNYNFGFWQCVDIFVYFSHYRVTIPPPSWINASHKHGVKILGTFITEGWSNNGELDNINLLDNSTQCIKKLVEISKFYHFDGWFINIETAIPSHYVEKMVHFVKDLTEAMHRDNPDSLVLWYDSVTTSGELVWQNELNEKNKIFFDECDGIFLNYAWNEEKIFNSSKLAGSRNRDVYVGIDVFGRGTFGGGGFNTYKVFTFHKSLTCFEALDVIKQNRFSVGLFAPGWTFENSIGWQRDLCEISENQFWLGQQYEKDVLQNGDYAMNLDHWKILENGGNGFKINVETPTENCSFRFSVATSHEWFRKSQEINLLNFFDKTFLDTSPQILLMEWFQGQGPQFHDPYYLKVDLEFDTAGQKLPVNFHTGEKQATSEWRCESCLFENYGPGLQKTRWEDGGKDVERWGGHYGVKMAAAMICIKKHEAKQGIVQYAENRHVVSQLPFVTSFGTGYGTMLCVEGKMNEQDVQPIFTAVTEDVRSQTQIRTVYNYAYNGGSSLKVCGTCNSKEVLLFQTEFPASSPLIVEFVVLVPQHQHTQLVLKMTSSSQQHLLLAPLKMDVVEDSKIVLISPFSSETQENHWVRYQFKIPSLPNSPNITWNSISAFFSKLDEDETTYREGYLGHLGVMTEEQFSATIKQTELVELTSSWSLNLDLLLSQEELVHNLLLCWRFKKNNFRHCDLSDSSGKWIGRCFPDVMGKFSFVETPFRGKSQLRIQPVDNMQRRYPATEVTIPDLDNHR